MLTGGLYKVLYMSLCTPCKNPVGIMFTYTKLSREQGHIVRIPHLYNAKIGDDLRSVKALKRLSIKDPTAQLLLITAQTLAHLNFLLLVSSGPIVYLRPKVTLHC